MPSLALTLSWWEFKGATFVDGHSGTATAGERHRPSDTAVPPAGPRPAPALRRVPEARAPGALCVCGDSDGHLFATPQGNGAQLCREGRLRVWMWAKVYIARGKSMAAGGVSEGATG